MIDNKVWDERYNVMIYDLLEKLRLNHNQMSLSLQQKPYGIICQVTSKLPVCKDLMYKDKRKFQHKQLDNGTHIYHLIMPLSSSTQLFSR